jgi:23S rRNA (cytidine1920-2'-O)/16S rRNA (cytidine1409-2'-O)-methyltransferase
MVRRGLASTTAEAREAIEAGTVTVGGAPAINPSSMIRTDAAVEVRAADSRFVSRGGEKLDAALERFGIDPAGRRCLDAGASTGGFTDVLLQAGAEAVVAVDVGYGQLAWSLRSDPRVVVLDRTNVRDLRPHDLPFIPSLLVADLSFISLRTVAADLRRLGSGDATTVVLVKPQFEADAAAVPAGGVVRDPETWRSAITGVMRSFVEAGFVPVGMMASPIRGRSGNVEFLLHARSGEAAAVGGDDVERALTEGARLAR